MSNINCSIQNKGPKSDVSDSLHASLQAQEEEKQELIKSIKKIKLEIFLLYGQLEYFKIEYSKAIQVFCQETNHQLDQCKPGSELFNSIPEAIVILDKMTSFINRINSEDIAYGKLETQLQQIRITEFQQKAPFDTNVEQILEDSTIERKWKQLGKNRNFIQSEITKKIKFQCIFDNDNNDDNKRLNNYVLINHHHHHFNYNHNKYNKYNNNSSKYNKYNNNFNNYNYNHHYHHHHHHFNKYNNFNKSNKNKVLNRMNVLHNIIFFI